MRKKRQLRKQILLKIEKSLDEARTNILKLIISL